MQIEIMSDYILAWKIRHIPQRYWNRGTESILLANAWFVELINFRKDERNKGRNPTRRFLVLKTGDKFVDLVREAWT